jgi:dTDP-4-dehydrorhamnose reductase
MTAWTPPVLIIGAQGQLGAAMAADLSRTCDVRALARRDLDLQDTRAIQTTVAAIEPELIVNCAAFNDVDGAEDRQAEAIAVNGLAVGALARAAERVGAVLVHYSTDFVFAGTADRLLAEDDPPEPQSVYAQSKLLGEWLARDCRRHYVLRVESLFGGTRRPSTVDRIVSALRGGEPMRLFSDRTVTPSFVGDVVVATRALVDRPAPFGLYHCVNTGATTWLELGRAIARLLDLGDGPLVPVSMKEVRMRAARPQYAALSNARLTAAGAAMPTWEEALRRYLLT